MSKQIEALKKALDDIEAEVRTTAGSTVFKSMARMRRMLEDGQDYTTTRNAWTGRETYKCNRCGREDFRSEHSAKFHKCQTVEEQPRDEAAHGITKGNT